MKHTLYIILFSLLMSLCLAKPVSSEQAMRVGQSFFAEFQNSEGTTIQKYQGSFAGADTDFYVIRFQPRGFVLVAGDDRCSPILGYSHTNPFPHDNMPAHIAWWFDEYSRSLSEIRKHPDWQIDRAWEAIVAGDLSDYATQRDVSPLVTADWDQDFPYNYHCPADPAGPGGHVYAGCIATTMAQIMKRWNHPVSGMGSHSYYATGYGNLSANFGATTYNWSSMPNTITNIYSPVSTLIYHCGVSVDMWYGPDASGALAADARYALVNYFRYNSAAQLLSAASYPVTTWANLLRADLDLGRPIFYGGTGPQGGHSFVLDGYQGNNHFHLNWGWSGNYNGYYYLNSLNPNGYSFTQNQSAILHIYPTSFATLSGSVTSQGEALADATVSINNTNFSAVTDANGHYSITGIPSATYQVTASAENYHPATSEIYIVSGSSPTLNFSLESQLNLPPIQNLQVDVDMDTVHLSWESPASTPEGTLIGFKVYRNGYLISTINHPVCVGFTDYGLQNSAYTYRVKASYLQGESIPISITVNVTELAALFSDDFEAYQDFAISFSPWNLVDQDMANTISLAGIDYPNATVPKAFMIFNPTATLPAVPQIVTHSGNKMAVSFSATMPPNSDWLITPRISLSTGSQLRFWAKSHSQDLERIKVGVCNQATMIPAAFITISGEGYVEVPDVWTEYVYDLSAYDGLEVYIGIRCVSDDAFALYIDDLGVYSASGNGDPFGSPIYLPNTMQVAANIIIEGSQASEGDVLAAYVSDNGVLQLRGKAKINIEGGQAVTMLTVYCNSLEESILFRVWDASSQQVFACLPVLTSVVNGIVGSYPDNLYQINAIYIAEEVAEPVANPTAGYFSEDQYVTLSCPTPNATLRYTLDGSTPLPGSPIFTFPIHIPMNSQATIKARAYLGGWTPSDIVTADYVVAAMVASPSFDPPPGSYNNTDIYVYFRCSTPGAEIRYTLDGDEPTESSSLYSAPVHLSQSTTIKARAYLVDWIPSPTMIGVYSLASGNDDDEHIPLVTKIKGIHPNPFNPNTTIAFSIGKDNSVVKIDIYNVKGQRVRGLAKDVFKKGMHQVLWDGKNDRGQELGSGTYLVKMHADGYVQTMKAVLLK